MEGESPENTKPASGRGAGSCPAEPGQIIVGALILPENLSDRKSKVTAFDNGGAMRAPLWRVLTDPKGDACPKLICCACSNWRTPAVRRLTCWR